MSDTIQPTKTLTYSVTDADLIRALEGIGIPRAVLTHGRTIMRFQLTEGQNGDSMTSGFYLDENDTDAALIIDAPADAVSEPAPVVPVKRLVPTEYKTRLGNPIYKCEPPLPAGNGWEYEPTEYVAVGAFSEGALVAASLYTGPDENRGVTYSSVTVNLTGYDLSAVDAPAAAPTPAPVAKKLVPTEHKTWLVRRPVYKCEPPAPLTDGSAAEYVACFEYDGWLEATRDPIGWDGWRDRRPDLTGYDLSAVSSVQ